MSPKVLPTVHYGRIPPKAPAKEATGAPLTLILPHGGSGSYGASAYAKRATGCLERARLEAQSYPPCEVVYKPSKSGPNAMLVGSLVHLMLEADAIGTLKPDDPCPDFWDEVCAWTPPQDAIDEAWRIYRGWVPIRTLWDDVKVVGLELALTADLSTDFDIDVPVSALIDRLVVDPDGVLCLEDIKTSDRSGDKHTRGRTCLQMHQYCMVAWVNGYDVQRIRVRQIVKTKVIKEEFFEIDLPTPSREDWMIRYFAEALKREVEGPTNLRGADCEWCPFSPEYGDGSCTL